MSPFNAWVLLKGLETLPLRVARQTKCRRDCGPARGHPKITRLNLSGPR